MLGTPLIGIVAIAAAIAAVFWTGHSAAGPSRRERRLSPLEQMLKRRYAGGGIDREHHHEKR